MKIRLRKEYFVYLACLFAFAFPNAGAHAGQPPDISADESLKDKLTNDGHRLVEQIYKAISDFKDYKFESIMYMWKSKPQEAGAGTYFFKRPNLVRVQVKSHGLKDGTIVVRQPDGRIRVAGGPKMRFLKMNLQEDSRMLQTPNGYNVIKSDLASLFAGLSYALANGSKAQVTAMPVAINRFKQNVIVLQVVKPEGSSEEVTDRVFIDPQSEVPLEWDVFRDGNRYSITIFENFTPNVGLEDDQFKL